MRHFFVLCFTLATFRLAQSGTIHLNLINDNNQTIIQHTLQVSKEKKIIKESASNLNQISFSPKKIGAAIAISVGSLYASLLLYLSYQAHNVRNYEGWGSWKKQVSLDVLQEIDGENIMQELCKDICAHYGAQQALISCMQDMHKELASLQHFLALHKEFKRWKIDIIFPDHQTEQLIAQEKIDRLYFLQSLFSCKYQLPKA